MNYDYLMVHYGELSTKGENKRSFIRELSRNIRHALSGYPSLTVTSDRDHTYIHLKDTDPLPIIKRLQDVSGIQRLSLVYRSDLDIDSLKQNALSLIRLEKGKTFKIVTQRANKAYPLDSYHVSCALADNILSHSSLTVDVHNPDIILRVNIRSDSAYLSAHTYPGAGGYPLGMNGKAMMLLSGGIDSPVAAYLLLRRGIRIECLHFAAPPYTSDAVIDKLKDILGLLNVYQEDIKLTVVPFTALQLAIYKNVDEPYCITIMRRMMFRIADSLAKSHHCLAIATGESVGQVASQTLESMVVINSVTNYPVLRPLCVSDKLDSISIAKKIGTYDISIRPFEDCCTIFKPKKPKTKPQEKDCQFWESRFDWQPLVETCVSNAKSLIIKDGKEKVFVSTPTSEDKEKQQD